MGWNDTVTNSSIRLQLLGGNESIILQCCIYSDNTKVDLCNGLKKNSIFIFNLFQAIYFQPNTTNTFYRIHIRDKVDKKLAGVCVP